MNDNLYNFNISGLVCWSCVNTKYDISLATFQSDIYTEFTPSRGCAPPFELHEDKDKEFLSEDKCDICMIQHFSQGLNPFSFKKIFLQFIIG